MMKKISKHLIVPQGIGVLSCVFSAVFYSFVHADPVSGAASAGIEMQNLQANQKTAKNTEESKKELIEVRENAYKTARTIESMYKIAEIQGKSLKDAAQYIWGPQKGEFKSGQSGDFKDVMAQFKNMEPYRQALCLDGGACTPDQKAMLDAVSANRAMASEAQQQANQAVFDDAAQQQKALQSDAQNLQTLQTHAQGAEGQMQALQYSNQIASQNTNQLMNIRKIVAKQQEAEAVREQARLREEQEEEMAANQLRRGTYKKSTPQVWAMK